MPFSEIQCDYSNVRTSAHDHLYKVDVDVLTVTAREYAESLRAPITVIVDANGCEFITNGARLAFAELAQMRCIVSLIIAADDRLMMQTLRTIQMISEPGRIRVCENITQALAMSAPASV